MEIDQTLEKLLKDRVNPNLGYFTKDEVIDIIMNTPCFFPLQQFLLAIELDHFKVPTME